jgi:hypothetical protein
MIVLYEFNAWIIDVILQKNIEVFDTVNGIRHSHLKKFYVQAS